MNNLNWLKDVSDFELSKGVKPRLFYCTLFHDSLRFELRRNLTPEGEPQTWHLFVARPYQKGDVATLPHDEALGYEPLLRNAEHAIHSYIQDELARIYQSAARPDEAKATSAWDRL